MKDKIHQMVETEQFVTRKAFGFQFQSSSDAKDFIGQLNDVLNASSADETARNSSNTSQRDSDPSRSSASNSEVNSMMNDIRKENREMKQMLQMLNNSCCPSCLHQPIRLRRTSIPSC